MITHVHRPLRVLLYEGGGSIPLPAAARAAVMMALLDKGYAVTRSGQGAGAMPHDDRSLLVLAAFTGAVPALEDATGQIHIDTRDITGRRHRLTRRKNSRGQTHERTRQMEALVPGHRLHPLHQLHAVIQVQNNDNCKTNCPACSRVCPEVAIMFPKYQGIPINGDVVNEGDARREKIKVDISSLLGGDIYSTLKDRSTAFKSRFSKERSADKALDERKKCLTKLVGDGFIPADVLASLPSPDEILKKAEAAKAKAAAALAAQ